MTNNILLETGTGELEIVEFLVKGAHYSINVLKIKEIIKLDTIAPSPGAPAAIAGKSSVRNQLVSVIDLRMVLHQERTPDYSQTIGLLCEFNQTTVVFLVDQVLGIKRIKWSELNNSDVVDTSSLVVGTILLNETIITLLDFESIVLSLAPKNTYYMPAPSASVDLDKKRQQVNLVLADDSKTVRALLNDALHGSGYNNLTFFNDGAAAYNYLTNLRDTYGEDFKNHVNLLITDIEMPMLDGYTLTRQIKEDYILNTLPVIIFSSLITDDLYHKGRQVGAEAQISKPSLKKLVAIIDELVDLDSL
ncbi:MAG: chemotaxis protein [Cellulosilyticaceae bacterium]